MSCGSCGGKLLPAEYVTDTRERLPARACARCSMLHLDEALGRTEAERLAIRRIKGSRSSGRVERVRKGS